MNFKIGYTPKKETLLLKPNRYVVSNMKEFQEALWSAKGGTTIYLRGGEYMGEINDEGGRSVWIDQFGEQDNYLHIENYPFEKPTFVNTQISFGDTARFIRFSGITIKDMINLKWSGAVYFFPGVTDIIFEDNEICNITCETYINESGETSYYGCNPLVLYGDMTYPTPDGNPFMKPISNIIIRNNYIHDCVTGWSEALTLEGNVENCTVVENTVDNTGNIGIDLAGNFKWTGVVGDPLNQARSSYVARNLVKNCQSPYATSAGIYCDGSRNVIIEQNVIYNSQCGIELGAEEPGAEVKTFYVRNNLIVKCGRGIGVGAYLETGATHKDSYVYNNTIICTNVHEENNALVVERTDNLHFKNNIIYGVEDTVLYQDWGDPRATNVFRENNCYFGHPSLSLPQGEKNSFWSNPLFVNNNLELDGDYHLRANSPCLNFKDRDGLSLTGFFDLSNNKRVFDNTLIDLGCYQMSLRDKPTPNFPIIPGVDIQRLSDIMYDNKRIEYIYLGTDFVTYKPRTNVAPSFASFLPSNEEVTIIHSSVNEIQFSLRETSTWQGVYKDLSKDWIGKPILIKVDEFIGSEYSLMIQDTNTHEDYGVINANNKSISLFVPTTCEGITMYIQNKDTTTTESCTVRGLTIYVDWLQLAPTIVGDNLIPSWERFIIEPNITVVESTDYNIKFNVTHTWTGIRWAIPKEYQGRNATLSVSHISPIEITLAIQSTDTWDFLTTIKTGETSQNFFLPSEGNYQVMITTEDRVPNGLCEVRDLCLCVDGVSLPKPDLPPTDKPNLFPNNWESYSKDTGVVINNMDNYSIEFTTEKSWSGINHPFPTELLDKEIWLGCDSLVPSQFTMSIQSTTTWDFVDYVDSETPFKKLRVPSGDNYIINIQSSKGVPSESCKLTNAFIYSVD